MHQAQPHPDRRKLLMALGALLAAACTESGPQTPAVAPLEIDGSTTCALDGMLLADYPGPKAQIHYEGVARPDFFCDTVEMFAIYLKPEKVRKVTGLFVQDMGRADWQAPVGAWIDARQAFFVTGSSRHGSMGPTFASFAQLTDAQTFARQYGGEIRKFSEITPEMTVLDGGALHDHNM
jgi:copper chaperone NosL